MGAFMQPFLARRLQRRFTSELDGLRDVLWRGPSLTPPPVRECRFDAGKCRPTMSHAAAVFRRVAATGDKRRPAGLGGSGSTNPAGVWLDLACLRQSPRGLRHRDGPRTTDAARIAAQVEASIRHRWRRGSAGPALHIPKYRHGRPVVGLFTGFFGHSQEERRN